MICPSCHREIAPILTQENRTVTIRAEDITLTDRICICPECQEIWSQEGFDYIAEAYTIYRNNRGMLQPIQIEALRKRLGLSHEGLGKLLDCSEITIQRYENGALQSIEHETKMQELLEKTK